MRITHSHSPEAAHWGASGPHYQSRMMNVTWLADTVRQCRDASVPLFVKQDSGRNPGEQGRIPDELWVRQFPKSEHSARPAILRRP